uniref:Trimethylguanosine synthase n=1 Tax=Acrobeloides nanus TaxID=290746 RepID=A0A914D2B0_9BILA
MWSGSSELSFEELQNFDFRFIPDRDFAFIARKAKKFFDNKSFLKKYWNQRYTYFSKLDDGILMDRESWFSVTPEKIAKHIANRLVKEKDTVILDGFCGAGGNSIQLALKGAIVYAIDLDPMKLRFALENAKIYGVADRINFICGNFFHIAESFIGSQSSKKEKFFPIDVVFLSPPWGGPSYLKKKIFSLEKMTPNGFEIFEIARQISPNIAYFLPRNTITTQLTSLAGPDGKVEIEKCLVEYKKPKKHIKESTFSDDPDENVESNQEKEEELVQKCKSLTVYYGNLVAEFDPKLKRSPKPDDFIEGTLTSSQLNEPMIENLEEENSEKSSDKYQENYDDELWDNRDVI